MRLLCFDQAKTLCMYVCMHYLAALLFVGVMVMRRTLSEPAFFCVMVGL